MTTSNEPLVYTIGHSTHPIERFIEFLQQYGITTVADVRSSPYSRYQPQFGKDILTKFLRERGIKYVFLGDQLGGRGNDKSSFDGGRVQYRKLAETAAFQSGIERVRTGSLTHRIALLCSEAEPLACHRTILVSRELEAAGTHVTHIHSDGHLESHDEAIVRLLQDLDMSENDLFRSREEIIAEAYAKQEERIAYVDTSVGVNESEVVA
jgi:uncharacterized protein (DUF488 family)